MVYHSLLLRVLYFWWSNLIRQTGASPLNISLDQLVEGENTLELTVLLESEVVKTVQIQIQKDSGMTHTDVSGVCKRDTDAICVPIGL